jgi:hypothetical protein
VDSSNYKKVLEARVGIEPTHKGFADLFKHILTILDSTQMPNIKLFCDTFCVTPEEQHCLLAELARNRLPSR